MAKKITAHEAALASLVPPDEKADFDQRVKALLARNQMLEAIDKARVQEGMTKSELAVCAGLNSSSVRRMFTVESSNPTLETAFRLFAALGIKLRAELPSGDQVKLVG